MPDKTISLPDLDVPIYRVFRLWQFEELIRMGHFWLTPPYSWDDPYEDFVHSCMVVERPTSGKFKDVILQNGHIAPA